MKQIVLKPLMAAALAVASLASMADAHESRLTMKRVIADEVLFASSHLPRALGRSVFVGPAVKAPVMTLKLTFACEVAGTPVEFPNDIRISNPYDFTVLAGTVAAYSAPFGNSGTVVLPALAPGAGVYVSNAVPGGITAGTPCSASSY